MRFSRRLRILSVLVAIGVLAPQAPASAGYVGTTNSGREIWVEGKSNPATTRYAKCRADEVMVAIKGWEGSAWRPPNETHFVHNFGLEVGCAPTDLVGRTWSQGSRTRTPYSITWRGYIGNFKYKRTDMPVKSKVIQCPLGHAVFGFRGRVGSWLDQIRIACREVVSRDGTTAGPHTWIQDYLGMYDGGTPFAVTCRNDNDTESSFRSKPVGSLVGSHYGHWNHEISWIWAACYSYD